MKIKVAFGCVLHVFALSSLLNSLLLLASAGDDDRPGKQDSNWLNPLAGLVFSSLKEDRHLPVKEGDLKRSPAKVFSSLVASPTSTPSTSSVSSPNVLPPRSNKGHNDDVLADLPPSRVGNDRDNT